MVTVDISHLPAQRFFSLGEAFGGVNPKGEAIGFTNCHMTRNGKPFFGVSGEMHFCRVSPDQWADSLVKLKAGGVNIVSTYVFWNVHEEAEGRFRFDGCRDLRSFLALCQREGLYVILRIGPFGHGEMRNGGLPDWLYGKPFEVRGNDEGYLACVRRLFAAIHGQIDGYCYHQGGPVIAFQIENEYMHSGAPWDFTVGTTNEWVPAGRDGEPHMLALKQIAEEEGLIAPFYTCTAWGGASAPVSQMLPLWGGYAYWPWIFQDSPGMHPPTPEYIYRQYHNDAVRETYNFAPRYMPEDVPFACCEMMGGMACSYHYRFALPWESVDALANVKLGSGCSLLGYYMYRGGTTPTGERTPFLMENGMGKLSYDFQAPIGEYGQLRPSYFRLRVLHEFCAVFADRLLSMRTLLPEGTEAQAPEDMRRLRFAVRTDGRSGFVFINNFQDHMVMPPRVHESIELQLADRVIRMEGLSLASSENAILPFRLDMGGIMLNWASCQPITHMAIEGEAYWFFMIPEGMAPELHFEVAGIQAIEGCAFVGESGEYICHPEPATCDFRVHGKTSQWRVVLLTRRDAMRFSHAKIEGRQIAMLSDVGILTKGEQLSAEAVNGAYDVMTIPANALRMPDGALPRRIGLFAGFEVPPEPLQNNAIEINRIGDGRFAIVIPKACMEGHKTVLFRLWYSGNIGYAFVNGVMISDNLNNGMPWDIRVDQHREALNGHPLTIVIVPLRHGGQAISCSPMAGRREEVELTETGIIATELLYYDDEAITIR